MGPFTKAHFYFYGKLENQTNLTSWQLGEAIQTRLADQQTSCFQAVKSDLKTAQTHKNVSLLKVDMFVIVMLGCNKIKRQWMNALDKWY